MSGLASLAILLVIAAGVKFALNRMGAGVRAKFNKMANSKISDLGAAKVVAAVGDTASVHNTLGRRTHHVTIGIKLLGTALSLFTLVYFADPSNGLLPEKNFMLWYSGLAACFAWYLGYIWTYALVIENTELSVPTWGFGVKTYDLKNLISIEEDGAYSVTLFFEDGRKAEILKYVAGRGALSAELNDHLYA